MIPKSGNRFSGSCSNERLERDDDSKNRHPALAPSVQRRIARPVAAFVVADENLCDLRVSQRLAGIVGQQVLLGYIGDVFGFGVLGEQMVIGLILVGTHLGGNRLVPLL